MIYKIRPHFTLNGAGQCTAETDEELLVCIKNAMSLSPTWTITVEGSFTDNSPDQKK
jgi:carbamoylphosphate synthase large subunit